MPKPTMTPEDVEALTKALQEMHTAEFDLQKAFLEQRPWEERDRAIKKARQTRYAWISLGAKFFRNCPYDKKVNGLWPQQIMMQSQ